MLYTRTNENMPDPELFRNPGPEYRCTPFWAWNCSLEEDLLRREIGCMKQMGMGGFHMHTRCFQLYFFKKFIIYRRIIALKNFAVFC